jgi:site-specific DNA-methyltransferase (adenine-specific)
MGDLEHEYGRQWEAIAFYPGIDHKFIKRPIDIISALRVNPSSLIHPNEKPINIITQLISHHCGETVLDPFMGSGTTLVAGKSLRRRCIGVEIELKYCQIAANRLRQEYLEL